MSTLLSRYKVKRIKNKEYDEKFKLIEKAMELSNGKANSTAFIPLLDSDTITAEDIARIAIGFKNIDNDNLSGEMHRSIWETDARRIHAESWKKDSYTVDMKKRWKDNNARGYMFSDTFVYRAMKKYGLNTMEMVNHLDRDFVFGGEEHVDREVYNVGDSSNYPFKTTSSTSSYYGCRDSVTNNSKVHDLKDILNMFYHAPKDLRTKITSDEKINLLFSTKAVVQKSKSYTPDGVAAHITDEEWRKFQIENMIQEFDWLVNAPDDIKELIYFDVEHYIEKRTCWTYPLLTTMLTKTFRYPCSDENVELVREAYSVMDYIGLGVVWNGDNSDNVNYHGGERTIDGTGVGKMIKKVTSMMRRFRADIKRGYNIQDVRDTIVEDLNIWSESKNNGRWKFFARNEFKHDYAELLPKSKKNKNISKMSTKDVTAPSHRGLANSDDWVMVRN